MHLASTICQALWEVLGNKVTEDFVPGPRQGLNQDLLCRLFHLMTNKYVVPVFWMQGSVPRAQNAQRLELHFIGSSWPWQ